MREPVVFPDLFDVKEAFITLSPSRSTFFGVGFIPLGEIHAYTIMFNTQDLDRFVRLIRAMDAVYVESAQKKIQKE